MWDGIKNIFAPVVDFFKGIFSDAWDAITNVFSGVKDFFVGIWDTISSVFSELGTKIGDAISGAVKSGINSIIGLIEKAINAGISLINGAITIINYIPGVEIGKIDKLDLPRLAKGGIADEDTIAHIGDGRGREAVLPLDDPSSTWQRDVAKSLAVELNGLKPELSEDMQAINYNEMVDAFKDALGQMRVELDGDQMGAFIDSTVTSAVYS
jgi:phage-related protein